MSTPDRASATPHEGRDVNGRFARGNKGGPGNPYAHQVAQIRKLLLNCLTPEDLTKIVFALVANAKAGDVGATKLLFLYTIGAPVTSAHPDRLDADELEAHQANSAPPDLGDRMAAMPAEPALELMRALLPGAAEEFRRECRQLYAERFSEDPLAGPKAGERAAVSKRQNDGPSGPVNAPRAAGFVEAESLRLVNRPGAPPRPADRPASATGRS